MHKRVDEYMHADSTAPPVSDGGWSHGGWSLTLGDRVGDLGDRVGDPGLQAAEHPGSAARPVSLSILMPVYNEERTLRRAIEALLSERYPVAMELRVVEDGSTDSTREILDEFHDPRMYVHQHPRNLGKGAALVSAAAQARGTHIVPFDADLEYSASDLPRMLAPIIAGRCDVVFGTRMFGMYSSYQSYPQAVGNRAMTLATNLLFNCYLSDVHTCLKMMPLELFLGLDLRERGFGLDAEVTARILQRGIRPFEVPVSYHSRSVADGKKITWRDGLHCLRVLSRVWHREPQSVPDNGAFQASPLSARLAIRSVRSARKEDRDTHPNVSGARNEGRDTHPNVSGARNEGRDTHPNVSGPRNEGRETRPNVVSAP